MALSRSYFEWSSRLRIMIESTKSGTKVLKFYWFYIKVFGLSGMIRPTIKINFSHIFSGNPTPTVPEPATQSPTQSPQIAVQPTVGNKPTLTPEVQAAIASVTTPKPVTQKPDIQPPAPLEDPEVQPPGPLEDPEAPTLKPAVQPPGPSEETGVTEPKPDLQPPSSLKGERFMNDHQPFNITGSSS